MSDKRGRLLARWCAVYGTPEVGGSVVIAGSAERPGWLIDRASEIRTLADLAELLRQPRRRHARQQRDSPLTYRDLAGKTGWSAATICTYFTGRILPPTDRLDAVAALLGATPAELAALATARDRIEERRR
jgi:transcriptional regulator with XRE-family HTH domain